MNKLPFEHLLQLIINYWKLIFAGYLKTLKANHKHSWQKDHSRKCPMNYFQINQCHVSQIQTGMLTMYLQDKEMENELNVFITSKSWFVYISHTDLLLL